LGLFNRKKETREAVDQKTADFIKGVDLDFGNASNSGVNVDEDGSLKVSTVYACVKVIAETVASLPLSLLKEETSGDKSKAKQHALYGILHDAPNDEMTSFTFREQMMTNLLLWGNAYALIQRDREGKIKALWPLRAKNMKVERDATTDSIKYEYTAGSKTVTYKPRQIFHIPAFTMDGILGVSPITYAREAVGLSMATEEFGARFFGNGAKPGGVLEHPGVVKDPEKLRDSWNKVYQGTKNSHKVAVLEEGMKYHEIGMSPEDSQFLQTRQFQINEICRIFRVPPHMVCDLSRSTFSNIEHQSIDFVVHTIRPWLVRWEQAAVKSLLNEEDRTIYFVKFNVDGLLRGDFKSRMEGYAIGRQNGWLSANDIRSLEDLNKIAKGQGGDDYLVNGNMIPIAAASKKEKGGDTS